MFKVVEIVVKSLKLNNSSRIRLRCYIACPKESHDEHEGRLELAWNAAANLHNGRDARGTIPPQISGGTNQIVQRSQNHVSGTCCDLILHI